MLSVISFILKILFSLTLTYFLISYSDKENHKHQESILKYNFFCVLLLSPIFDLSVKHNEFTFVGFVIIVLLFYIYIENKTNSSCIIYIKVLIISLLISFGYIFTTILCIALYILFLNNLVDLIKPNYEEEEK